MAKVVHLAVTPLAGAPIRLSSALNAYTTHQSRFINLDPLAYGGRTFPEDLCWADQREECLQLLAEADLLHFHHHNFDLQSANNPFGIDFSSIAPANCRFLIHLHSAPRKLERVCRHDYPALVIPHFPERYYPGARIVPNVVDLAPSFSSPETDLVFAPSRVLETAWEARWDTKACPETVQVLQSVARLHPEFRFEVVSNSPFTETIKRKAASRIVLEETATGSYHQGALEGLALGKAVLCHLDSRSRYILQKLTGAADLPFLESRLENLGETLGNLLAEGPSRLDALGHGARRWYDAYYAPAHMVRHYDVAYTDILESEKCFYERTELARAGDFSSGVSLLTIGRSELGWQLRKLVYASWRQNLKDFRGWLSVISSYPRRVLARLGWLRG